MGSDKHGAIQASSDRGVIATHPDVEPLQILVGPSTAGQFNRAQPRLIPVACFSVEDASFKFDSSFILPAFQEEIKSFIDLREKDPERIKGAPISIFGHADPTFQGNFELGATTHHAGDDYNKVLSGRRAIAVYALFTRDAALWNNLFVNNFGGDVWGEDSISTMLDLTERPSSSGNLEPTASDSARNAKLHDIAQDSGQRQQLFVRYMNALCGELKLDKTKDFLARGAGPDQKGDVQGCSRFNPRLLFSIEKEAQFKNAAFEKDEPILRLRNADNSPNRRVMILIFRKRSQVLPAKWPCPTFKEGSAGCNKRFFSDGDERRSTHSPGADRNFDHTHDTFACRFYQRLSDGSPCNVPVKLVTLVIRLVDVYHKPIKSTKYVLEVGEMRFKGQSDDKGIVTHRIPVSAATARLVLPMWTVDLLIQPLDAPDSSEGAKRRLDNLGYFAHDADDSSSSLALMRFQSVCDEQQTDLQDSNGIMRDSTKHKLIEDYGT